MATRPTSRSSARPRPMTTTVEIDHYLIVRLRGQAAKRNTSVPRLIADIVKAVATDGLTTAVLATSENYLDDKKAPDGAWG